MFDICNVKPLGDILQIVSVSVEVVNESKPIGIRERMALLLMVVDDPLFATWSDSEGGCRLQRGHSWHQLYGGSGDMNYFEGRQ